MPHGPITSAPRSGAWLRAAILACAAATCSLACGEVVVSDGRSDAAPPDATPAPPDANPNDAALPDAAPAPPDADLPDPSLIARYSLDSASDGQFRDDSGNGHDAVCMDTCPPIGGGVFGTSASFGAGPYLQITDDGAFVTGNGFTVSAWASIRELPDSIRAAIVSKPFGTGIANSWQLVIENDGRPSFFSSITDDDFNFLRGDDPLPIGQFVHLAISWDGTTKRLYVAGQLVGASTAEILFTTDPVVIGADLDNQSPGARFDGLIDEIQIYSRTLSDAELAALAERP